MSFIYIFGLLAMFIRVAVNTTNGYLVHYATFMASRAYLVHDENNSSATIDDQRAEAHAKAVFKKYKVTELIPQSSGKLEVRSPGAGGHKLLVGVYHSFKQNFSPMPLVGGTTPVELVSESFLGREPSRQECLDGICNAFKQIDGYSSCRNHSTFFDNGC